MIQSETFLAPFVYNLLGQLLNQLFCVWFLMYSAHTVLWPFFYIKPSKWEM